jgi:hypothetical protein
MAFLNSPCYETPKNAIFGEKQFFFPCFSTPLVTKRPKNAFKTNPLKKNKKKK